MIKTCGLALLNNLLTLKHFSRIPHKFFYGRLFQKCMSTCSQVFFRIAVLGNLGEFPGKQPTTYSY